jgi:hypothetical protein
VALDEGLKGQLGCLAVTAGVPFEELSVSQIADAP